MTNIETHRPALEHLKFKFKDIDPTTVPISVDVLIQLFKALNHSDTCDHTQRKTEQLLRDNELDAAPIIRWMEYHGGYCDCEIEMNALPKALELANL